VSGAAIFLLAWFALGVFITLTSFIRSETADDIVIGMFLAWVILLVLAALLAIVAQRIGYLA
jgi:hypothetical protein